MDGQDAIVIASAARTPVGSFNGTLSSVPAHGLGNRRHNRGYETRRNRAG